MTGEHAIGPGSTVTLHPLSIRDSDDDPTTAVVGRIELGEFVELPNVGVAAVRLLGAGLSVAEVEARIRADHDLDIDVAELAEALVELAFASSVDDQPVADPVERLPGSHLPAVRARHVRWLFSWPIAVLWLGVLIAAALSWVRHPELLPAPGDFYWTPYVGLAVLVNTVLFSASATVHELMHLAAARSYDVPARIGLSTRLHYLVLQTDVTGVWSVPRRRRYRVYLAGMLWDTFVIGASTLLIVHGGLPDGVDRMLAALSVVVLLSLFVQAQVYMRTDLYYVLMEWLRCGNLFQDGLAYARHLARRVLRRSGTDPTSHRPARERRAIRIYAVAMVLGSAVALSVFAFLGLPILIEGVVRALTGLIGGIEAGNALRAVDSALIILVEVGLQAIFLRTFYRQRVSAAPRGRVEDAVEDVDDQVGHDDEQRREHHHAEDHG